MRFGDSGLAIKKTLFHPQADEIKRIRFQIQMTEYEVTGRNIVYLDESGFAVDMPRTHGYSLSGKRCAGERDWHARGRCNVIGAILGFSLITVCLFDTNINSDIFYAWLTQDLIPKLPVYSVVVMDNASFHKRSDMVDALRQEGHTLAYLPVYSPDLNPIEHKWFQAKALRKRLRCSVSELFSYI